MKPSKDKETEGLWRSIMINAGIFFKSNLHYSKKETDTGLLISLEDQDYRKVLAYSSTEKINTINEIRIKNIIIINKDK